MSGKIVNHLLVATFGYADFVFGDELQTSFLINFLESALGSMADGAFFGSFGTFVYVTAYGTDKFLFHNVSLFYVCFE